MKRWQVVLGLIVSAVFLWLALRGLNLTDVLAGLRSANYLWLIPGIAVYFLAVVIRTWRWHYLLKPLKPVSVRHLFPTVVIGYMGNNVYPARAGELLRAYVLKRNEGVSVSSSLATVIVERIFDGLVMLVFVFVALPTVPFLPDAVRSIVIFGSLVFFSALIVFLFLAARPALAARLYNPLIDHLLPHRLRDKVRGFIDRFMIGLAALRDFEHIIMIFFTSILIWLLETVKYWFVMHAFSFEVSFFTLMLMSLAFSAPLTAEKKNKDDNGSAANLPEVIWCDRGDVASLNLFYGAGGLEHAPDPKSKFIFVKENAEGTSPKFEVMDDQGVLWKVKLGQESGSETAATRFLWAAGYFVDEDYYLPQIKVIGLPKLRRGEQFVSSGGTVRSVRLERLVKGVKRGANWSWFNNPFLNRREFIIPDYVYRRL